MTDHLFCNHNNSLRGKSSIAVIEEIFKGRAEEVNNKDVVQAFLTEIIYIRYAGCFLLA